MIYEYKINVYAYETYAVFEGKDLNETDERIHSKFGFIGTFFTVNRAFTEHRFEQLQEKAQEIQHDLEVLILREDLDTFKTEVEKFRQQHAILVDFEKKILRVYPTLDPTFKNERKYHVLQKRQQSQRDREEKLA